MTPQNRRLFPVLPDSTPDAAPRIPMAGVTLVELMVVMSLLALAMTVVGPAVGSTLDNMRFRTFGGELEHAFRVAQAGARTAQEPRFIAFDTDRFLVFDRRNTEFGEVALPPGVAMESEVSGAWMATRSGMILGLDNLVIVSGRGRAGTLVLDGFDVRFVEGRVGPTSR